VTPAPAEDLGDSDRQDHEPAFLDLDLVLLPQVEAGPSQPQSGHAQVGHAGVVPPAAADRQLVQLGGGVVVLLVSVVLSGAVIRCTVSRGRCGDGGVRAAGRRILQRPPSRLGEMVDDALVGGARRGRRGGTVSGRSTHGASPPVWARARWSH